MIWITGDCHAGFNRFSTKRFPAQKEMTKDKHHFGVRNIIESMNLIGGKVEFYTKPNEGMNIVLKVPCSRLATEKSEGSTK